jgi:hypothetical protein
MHGTKCRLLTDLLFSPQSYGTESFSRRSTIRRMEEKPGGLGGT